MEPFEVASGVWLRRATLDDLPDLLRICLETGNYGSDATNDFYDKEILGRVYTAPYLLHAMKYAYVVTAPEVCGYMLGVLDTVKFENELDKNYWPNLQANYQKLNPYFKDRDIETVQMIMNPSKVPANISENYPSHFHIDLLPKVQGKGVGSKIVGKLLAELDADRSTGVHLGVGSKNIAAQRFYAKMGFADLETVDDCLYMGRQLK